MRSRLVAISALAWLLKTNSLVAAWVPDHFDLREMTSAFPPVTLQQNCGGTWAFSTIDTMAMNIALREDKVVALSAQHIVSCNPQGLQCFGGGYPQLEMMVDPGAVLERDFPFTNQAAPCPENLPVYGRASRVGRVKVEAGSSLPTDRALKEAIFTYGPVLVGVNASQWSGYTGGIFQKCKSGGQPNHLVNLIGWDDNGGFWIARNTWGPKWGDGGYILIPFGCGGMGEFASYLEF